MSASAPPPPSRRFAKGTLWRLLKYVGHKPGLVALSVATMIASATVDLWVPKLVQEMVDGPITNRDAEAFSPYIMWILVALGLGMLTRAARAIVSVLTGLQIGMGLRLELFSHIQKQSLRFFDRNPVGLLTTRVTGDIEAIEQFFSSGVAAFFHDALKLVLILGVLFFINAPLAGAVLAVVPILLIVSTLFARWSRRDFSRVRTEAARTNAWTTEALGGVRVTRLFGREAHARRTYANHVERWKDAHLATVRNFAFFFPAVKSIEALAVTVVVWFGAEGILDQTFTAGEFFQFFFYIGYFFEPIRTLSENFNMLLQAGVCSERVFKILDQEPEISAPSSPVAPDPAEGTVAFEDVHFRYVEDEPVLRGVSFEAPAGSTLAIVGPTGAGKSSILGLISRFYDVQRGTVRVDGIDVREQDPSRLRRRIAMVLQDVFLFRGSVLDNIRLFDPAISRERVEDAVRAIHGEGILARLPGGLDATVEERGANFSVGERQIIAFARAMVHDPDILVLDEATASIDTATERLIQEALDTVRAGRTTIIVAHRLSTVRTADRILVLRRGEVVESGTHEELLRAEGLYRRMYALQVRDQTA